MQPVEYGTGPVVQAVLILLILLSVLSWAIILWKWFALRRVENGNREFVDLFWASSNMDHVYEQCERLLHSPVCVAFRAAYIELSKIQSKKAGGTAPTLGEMATSENLLRTLQKVQNHENMRLEQFLGFLGSVGSTAPFIGLFGTVWGIMGSFQGIAETGSASLAVVAPGISEALIATAVGLVAAIPAVAAYNYFVGRVRTVYYDMDSFGRDFVNIVQRSQL